jgi:hypothetical protein
MGAVLGFIFRYILKKQDYTNVGWIEVAQRKVLCGAVMGAVPGCIQDGQYTNQINVCQFLKY